jgi:hypothetical protein
MEWKEEHGKNNRKGMGASQTCGDSSFAVDRQSGKE